MASGPREVRAVSPIRRAAEALFYNPYHAPPPAPPPPHPPGVETEDAHAAALPPLQRSAILPVMPPVCWARDVLATIFPALFSSERHARPGQAEMKAEVQQVAAAERLIAEAGDAAASLPACCRSSYRTLLMSLLMPFLTDRPEEAQSVTALPEPPPALRVAAAESRQPPLLIADPKEHPEVLFDCAADCDGAAAADGGLEEQRDEEDSSEVYFVHIYERYLAMAEDLSW